LKRRRVVELLGLRIRGVWGGDKRKEGGEV